MVDLSVGLSEEVFIEFYLRISLNQIPHQLLLQSHMFAQFASWMHSKAECGETNILSSLSISLETRKLACTNLFACFYGFYTTFIVKIGVILSRVRLTWTFRTIIGTLLANFCKRLDVLFIKFGILESKSPLFVKEELPQITQSYKNKVAPECTNEALI